MSNEQSGSSEKRASYGPPVVEKPESGQPANVQATSGVPVGTLCVCKGTINPTATTFSRLCLVVERSGTPPMSIPQIIQAADAAGTIITKATLYGAGAATGSKSWDLSLHSGPPPRSLAASCNDAGTSANTLRVVAVYGSPPSQTTELTSVPFTGKRVDNC